MIQFLARVDLCSNCEGSPDFKTDQSFPDRRNTPFGFESLSPLAPSSAILQAINRIDLNKLDSESLIRKPVFVNYKH